MQEIGIGFIGAGDIASIHKEALSKLPGVRLAAVYDVDEARSERMCDGTGPIVCKSADELVHAEGVDAVYVLTPQKHHFEGAVVSLNARKHTFIEKPVSLSRAEILEMIRLSEENSCLCVPGHNYIHAHDIKLAKELVDSGRLGDIRGMWVFFMVSLPPGIRNRIPGPLREVMIHQFYSTLFLVGRPNSIFAVASDFSGHGEHNEDQASIVAQLPSGAIVNLFATFVAEDLTGDPWTLKYKIIGNLGSASHSWSTSKLSERLQPVWDLPAYWDTFREEDRYFIEECIRGNKKPLSSMRDALTCLDMLEAAEASIATGEVQHLL